MIKVDLITGFLGSGKTTFLKKYAKYFMDQGKRVGILENDFGAVNVDMMLLSELRGDKCELEMVAGGCDADCHRRRFKTKLIAMGMSGYDRVIIEPSGIFDVDEFFDAIHEEPLDRWYEVGNVIAIVDAGLREDLSVTGQYYLASQLAHAGQIVFSRVQLTTPEELEKTEEIIENAAKTVHLERDLKSAYLQKDWEKLTEEDWKGIASCEYRGASYIKLQAVRESDFESICMLELPMNTAMLKEKLPALFAQEAYGHIFRIKGFYEEAGSWYEVNATSSELQIEPILVGQQVLIVIGEGLDETGIRELL